MTQKHIQALVAIIVGLVLLMFVLRSTDDTGPVGADRLLLPELAAAAGAIATIRVTGVGDAGPLDITRDGDRWSVVSRGGYAADVGLLRQLVISLSEARIVEEKTSNPDNYARLGVDDPEEGGEGTMLSLSGDGFDYTVILGNTAQGDYRYARVAGDATSYLVDQDPRVPGAVGDWLDASIADIPAERIRRVTIRHSDGETIVIEKDSQDQVDFSVRDVPVGRELSYASVGNGIGGALGSLELDDVRVASEGEALATTVFETWNDARIRAELVQNGDDSWVTFSADPDIDGLNARVAGWQYRLPEFKQNLLLRRWDDLLREEEGPPEE